MNDRCGAPSALGWGRRPGNEAVDVRPAWFCYEPMPFAADAVPRTVALPAFAGLRVQA
jgi:hypothetical protein